MKQTKDKFSEQAAIYKNHRPTYPEKLYDIILNATKNRGTCWDCATGNGQVAIVLAEYFETVYATDISEQQLLQAPKKENIIYSITRAEQTPFDDNFFDLITVAQAMHWFDFNAFNKEAKRVLKDDGTICVWGYGPLKMEDEIGILVNKFYKDIIGPYWDAERNHIDEAYKNVTFNFEDVKLYNDMAIESDWSIENLKGYFDSWSSVRNYISKNGHDPVPLIMEEIADIWKKGEMYKAKLPVFLKVGKKIF